MLVIVFIVDIIEEIYFSLLCYFCSKRCHKTRKKELIWQKYVQFIIVLSVDGGPVLIVFWLLSKRFLSD